MTSGGLNIINRLYDKYGEVHWIDFNDIATYTDRSLPVSGDSIISCAPRFGDSSIVSGTSNPKFRTTNRNFIEIGEAPLIATLISGNELARSIYIVHRYTGTESISGSNTLFYIGAFDLSQYIWSYRNPIEIGLPNTDYNIDYSGSSTKIKSDYGSTSINYIFSSRDTRDGIQNAKLHTDPESEVNLNGFCSVSSNNGTALYTSGGNIWLWLGGKPNVDPSNPDDGVSLGDYDIGEIIIVGAYVSDQEDKDIISYLNNKWKDWS